MKRTTLQRTICFVLVMMLIMCEATVGVAATESFAEKSNEPIVSEETISKDKYKDWSVKDIVYKDHLFESGEIYSYTGSQVKPELAKLTVEIAYEKDGLLENVSKTITTFDDAIISYSNNISIGTGYMKVTVEGKEISIPFSIIFGRIASFKAVPKSYKSTNLKWNKVVGAAGYVIYRSNDADSGFKAIKTITSGSTVNYVNTGLKLGTVYYYKMRPYRIVDGNKVYGEYTAVIKQKAQPARPTISSVKKGSYNSLKISWKKISGSSGYTVYRSDSSDGPYKKIKTVRATKKSTLSYTDKKRTCGKVYYYKVYAFKRSGLKNHYSYASLAKSGKTTPSTTKFNSNTQCWTSSVTLKWNKSSGAKGYEIYRSTSASSGYELIKTSVGNSTRSWTDSGLDSKVKYYYKIRPYTTIAGKKVTGKWSAVKKIKAKK